MSRTSSQSGQGGVLQFAGFELDPAGPELRLNGEVVAARPKSLALIGYLATRPGQLVRKEDLVDAVWGDTAVTDATLARTLFDAREALGDDSREPRFIETVHRLGFRFLGRIESEDGPPAETQAAASSNLVGRERERQRLDELKVLAESGSRQMVFLVGEAGIGKTTILEKFLSDCSHAAPSSGATPARSSSKASPRSSILIARGQCIEHYGTGEAYLPLLDALGELCRSAAAEDVVPVLRRVAPTWLAQFPWLIDESDRAALEREMRGVTADRMLRELAQALETIAQQRLLVIALEDLHWCDSATADLLAFLARRPASARLLVVATYRPVDAILAENPIRPMHQELLRQGRCQNLAIEPLPAGDVGDLVARRFREAPFAERLAEIVHRRTEGHPLFVVSMLEDLISQGIIAPAPVDGGWLLDGRIVDVEGKVPDDLKQMVRTQVERLEPEERAVVEAASIIGVSFSAAAAAAALQKDPVEVEDLCEAMSFRGVFLDRAGMDEWPDGTSASAYSFRHALYRDALYDAVPGARRRRLHQRVGERLETAHAADPGASFGVLGMHFEQAGDRPRAARYLRQAGEVAARRGAPREALALFARARTHLEQLPLGLERTTEQLMIEMAAGPALAAIKGYAAPELEDIFTRARELCRALGDGPQLFPVLWGLWAFWCVRGKLNYALELASQVMALAQEGGDREMIIEGHHALWVTLFFRGDVGEAGRHMDAAIALYDRREHHAHVMLFGQDPGVVALSYRGLVWQLQGNSAEADRKCREAVELGRSLGHPVSLNFAVGFTGWIHMERGDAQGCRKYCSEVMEIATTHGLSFWQAHTIWILGRARAVEDLVDGIREMRAGIDALIAIGARMGVAGYLAKVAAVLLAHGERDEARRLLDEAWTIGEEDGELLGRAEVLQLRGDLEIGEDASDESVARAEALYREAVNVAHRQEATTAELSAAMRLEQLLRDSPRAGDASSLLAEVLSRVPGDGALPGVAAARERVQAMV